VPSDLVRQILDGHVSFFEGSTALTSTGWLRHPERYFDEWLDNIDARRPQRYARTLLLGMGGSSSPARLYADWRHENTISVIDTSNPDTIAGLDFREATVIASSKSGGTVETQTLLAHALASGLSPEDLVIITDPGTSLAELGESLGALVVLGDPHTGGRFSSLSPFGLVPALYAGWSPEELRDELSGCYLTDDLAARAVHDAAQLATAVVAGAGFFSLGADPITSGGALWLEQLVAETTGKFDRGFIPLVQGPMALYRPGDMQYYHLLAALLAWHLGVDPFNQPNVESAKKGVVALLNGAVLWEAAPHDQIELLQSLSSASYIAVQAYAPLAASHELAALRVRIENEFGATTANLGPRYLHSTGQLHKGGPLSVVGLQIIQRPRTEARRISGRTYSFHDLHMAQAIGDYRAMAAAGRRVYQLLVDDVSDVASLLGLAS
jgi:glucose-6-phosphate isomerase